MTYTFMRRNVLTCYAREKLTSKTLDLTIREGHKVVALEEIEHAAAEQVHDNADMSSVVEAVSEVDASVTVVFVVLPQSLEHTQLYPRGVSILLHGPDDLDSDELIPLLIVRLYDLAECALAEKFNHFDCA